MTTTRRGLFGLVAAAPIAAGGVAVSSRRQGRDDSHASRPFPALSGLDDIPVLVGDAAGFTSVMRGKDGDLRVVRWDRFGRMYANEPVRL